MPWLSDLGTWAAGLFSILQPGGRFVTVEFHPLIWVFDLDWSLRYDFFLAGSPYQSDEGVADYGGASAGLLSPSGHDPEPRTFVNPHWSYEFQWPLSEVVSSLIGAGLYVETLTEYPWANGWKPLNGMRSDGARRTWPPDGLPNLPLMYSLSARRP